MGTTLAIWLTRYRNMLALASLLLAIAAGAGLQHSYFETGYRIFFADDNPYMVANDFLEDTYTRSDTVSFIIAPKTGTLFTRDALAAIEELTEESWQFPYSMRVDSLTNYQYTWADSNGLVVENLFEDSANLSDAEIARRRDIALADPVLINNVINPTGTATIVNLTLQFDDNHDDAGARDKELVNLARDIRDRYELENPNLKIYVFGMITVNNAFNEMTEHDLTVFTPIMSAILFLAIWILFTLAGTTITGGLLSSLSIMLVITLSTAAAMGSAGWLDFPFNAVNAVAPTIILTIAVADCVHILFAYFNGLRSGLDKEKALQESLEMNIQPVFLTSLTTAVGFMALNFSDTPPMHSLGTLTAIGIIAAFILALAMLPALLVALPLKPRRNAQQRSTVMTGFADHVLNYRRGYFWGTLAFTAFALFGISRNTLNDSTMTYFDDSVPYNIAAHFYENNLSGFDTISYSLDSGEQYGINEPEFLRKVDRFVSWAETQPHVSHVSSYTRVIKRLNRNMHNDNPEYYRIPDSRELASQYLLLYELSLPFGLDLTTQLDGAKSATRIDIRIRKQKPHEVVAMEAQFSQWLSTNLPDIEATPGTSQSIMFAHMGQRNIDSMLLGNVVAIVLITLILIVALKSLRYGLISMLPNALPALVTVGLWGYFNGEVNLAVALIFVITLGIVVDDTVHFISKYLRARRRNNMSPDEAVRYAFANVGNALIITSIVLTAGFMVLAQSNFQVNAIMGLLVAITIFVALAFDFLFLPPLLEKHDSKRSHKEAANPAD
jgi:predicted RND superfamily exporter protein